MCVSYTITNVSKTFPTDSRQVSGVGTVYRMTFGIGYTVGNTSDSVRLKCRLWPGRERTTLRNRCPRHHRKFTHSLPLAPLVTGGHDEGHGTATGFQSFVAGAPVNSARLKCVVFFPLFLCPSLRHSGSVLTLYIVHSSSVRPPFDRPVGPHSIRVLAAHGPHISLHYTSPRTPTRFAHCFVPTSITGRCKPAGVVRPHNCIMSRPTPMLHATVNAAFA